MRSLVFCLNRHRNRDQHVLVYRSSYTKDGTSLSDFCCWEGMLCFVLTESSGMRSRTARTCTCVPHPYVTCTRLRAPCGHLRRHVFCSIHPEPWSALSLLSSVAPVCRNMQQSVIQAACFASRWGVGGTHPPTVMAITFTLQKARATIKYWPGCDK